MAVRCPKGHWYDPEVSGVGHCPQCAIQTGDGPPVSDDDVLAIMNLPEDGGGTTTADKDATKGFSSSAIMRRKKVCPECSHEASFSFVYCPRCGAPLKIASVELQ